jgi:hypothetical protein
MSAAAVAVALLVGTVGGNSVASAKTKKTYTYVCLHSTNDNLDIIAFNKSRGGVANIKFFPGSSTTPTTATAQPRQTTEYGLIPSNNHADSTTITSNEPLLVGGNESVQNDITINSTTTYWYTTWDITCH